MTITLSADLEKIVLQKAHDEGVTPETVVLNALRAKLGVRSLGLAAFGPPQDEWERRLLNVGTPCGTSVNDEALSSERLYD